MCRTTSVALATRIYYVDIVEQAKPHAHTKVDRFDVINHHELSVTRSLSLYLPANRSDRAKLSICSLPQSLWS